MSRVLSTFFALDGVLVREGFPPLSPWWRETLTRVYSADRRQAVLRVGRRGGKSSVLCRVAVAEALAGEHVIPPGDVGVVAFVSVSRDEAAQRLRTIRAILDAIGIGHRPIEGGIELTDRPIVFKVYAATLSSVAGFTCITAICDEVARWRDLDTGANPAREVLASLRPTLATQPTAKIFLCSSPLSTSDAHATAFDEGETDFQTTAYAESWVANPSLSEADTHKLEPDMRIWTREYGAIPQASVCGAFDADAVRRAFRSIEVSASGAPALILDPSSGRKDTWSWGIARWVRPVGMERDVLRFELVSGIDGGFWQNLSGADVVTQLVEIAHRWGVRSVHSDQRESMMLGSEFRKHGLAFHEHVWTQPSKTAAVAAVRRWFSDGAIVLPDHERMHRELLAFEERITPAGAFTFGARGSGHDDYVSLLITCAMAEADRALVPSSAQNRVHPTAIRAQFDDPDFLSPLPRPGEARPSFGPNWRVSKGPPAPPPTATFAGPLRRGF